MASVSKKAKVGTTRQVSSKRASSKPVAPAAGTPTSCFILWFECTQNGGCPDLRYTFVTTSPAEIKSVIEGDLADGVTPCLLVDCRPIYEVRVVQCGKLAKSVDLYPFLSAALDGKSFRLDPKGVKALIKADGGAYESLGEATWTTAMDWARFEAALPALDAPVAKKKARVRLEDPRLPRELAWGRSSNS
jgi:hypothetical protein